MLKQSEQYRKEIGVRIRTVRQKSGLSQTEFAKRVGCSQPSIVRFESGTRMPESYLVKMICEQFGCRIEWLVMGEGDSGLK
jgi:transcriptional regulator with XRE-family HTH domain